MYCWMRCVCSHVDRPLNTEQPTSALDQESEAAVQEAIDSMLTKAAGSKTSITVAHRLNTIRDSTVIFVMSHGRIVERGSHDELMLIPSGLYRKFVHDQGSHGFVRLTSQLTLPATTRQSFSRQGCNHSPVQKLAPLLEHKGLIESHGLMLAGFVFSDALDSLMASLGNLTVNVTVTVTFTV